ncbi:hypothetical protein CMQ_4497 [Grosmannia clavigera kw1407]|uniref:DUF2293 domain-containing protein n=1 Tax=Grosmannia clavigera (strain kw1407 / UAMH 11150) TaxID=655863 RepID=F0XTK4_GROCL|nr:uncharacterized protein CMQ_4497 [Grosmannia clavigera kw1407]EFW98645.1 hypothetical protein CMQ_4497 [Grosmannia clavigera kw1407]
MPGGHAKERHKKSTRAGGWNVPAPATLNARPEAPGLKSKHHSYFELVENKDKKKKLEFKAWFPQPITSDRQPPPGFEFVPIGNPELTTACKELSREQDALIFIVSTDKRAVAASLSYQVNRIGHHIRQMIVEQARASIGDSDHSSVGQNLSGLPEPIPGATKKGEPLVGLAKDITLSRRVQLAVLAHIRHTHTRYDRLLKETSYANARRTVEALCLDILVKWRGDEETGRDQLDEILREVIVISDSEGEDDGYTSDTANSESDDSVEDITRHAAPDRVSPVVGFAHYVVRPPAVDARSTTEAPAYDFAQDARSATVSTYVSAPSQTFESLGVKRGRRGFRRYEAALTARWDEAKNRVRLQEELPGGPNGPTADRLDSHYEPPQQDPSYALEPPSYWELSERREAVQDHGRPAGYGAQRRVVHPSAIHGGYPAYEYDQPPMQLSGPYPDISAPPLPHRVFSHPLPRNNSPRNGPGYDLNPRAMVRSQEVQDYLVPSIEPSSPTGESDAFVPILVRTLPPRPSAQESYHGEALARYDMHHSPSWGEESYDNVKHRRVTSDSTFIRLPPHQEPHPVYVAREDHHGQGIVPYVRAPPFGSSVRAQAQEDYRQASAWPIAQPTSLGPAPAPVMRAYHPIGGPMRPVVVDDWPVHAPQLAPQVGMTSISQAFQENNPRERRMPEARREMYHFAGNLSDSSMDEYIESQPRAPLPWDDLGCRQSLKRTADGARFNGENPFRYDPQASRPLEQQSAAVFTARYGQQHDRAGQYPSGLPMSAADVQPDARYFHRVDNAWPEYAAFYLVDVGFGF